MNDMQGSFFLRKKPLEFMLPAYSNSETAIARAGHVMEQLGQIPWKYSNPTRSIRSNVVSAKCH
jgi:hypothetical protein